MNFEKEVKLLQLQVSDILRKIKAKSTSWGQLLGDIRNQKDLMRYFGLKQDLLKSGKNIKTINGQSILGSGDLQVDSLLGFTPEDIANKATDFTIINDTLYPSVEAVKEQLDLKADLVGGKIPASQLPSYVDDVLEFVNLASFPVTGETGKIYVALDTNFTYRWSGSAYVQIGGSTQGKDYTYRAWIPLGHTSTIISTIGVPALTINGTLSTDVIVGSATKFNRIKKLSAVSAGTAGSSAGWRNAGVYTAFLELETEWEQSFYFGDTSATEVTYKRVFVGFKETIPAITNVDPSTLGNAFGMACDGADTNYQFMYNFNGMGLTKIDLGISKTGAGVDFFHLKISKKANERIINYYVKNIITGVEVSGSVSYLSGANSKCLLEHIHINNNTTAEPVRIGFGEISMKDYY